MSNFPKIFAFCAMIIAIISAKPLYGGAIKIQPKIFQGPSEFWVFDANHGTYVPFIYLCVSVEDAEDICELDDKCSVPFPECFYIYALKQSMVDPSCWCSAFEHQRLGSSGYTHIGHCEWSVINGENCDRQSPVMSFMCACPGRNGYDLEFCIGPVNSGNYKILIEAEQWPDWECGDGGGPAPWGQPEWVITDEKHITIKGDALDIALFSNIYYWDRNTDDRSYDGQYINPFTPYRVITNIYTTRNNEADMPGMLIGHLNPNGGNGRIVRFYRYPELDQEPPCHMWDFCFYTFAYMSDSDIRPKDLWLYTDEQWNELKRDMTINLTGAENQVQNDISAKVWVQYLLHLDCLNDTSVCFIPADDEKMEFLFTYSKYLDLDPESKVKMLISNRNGPVIYSKELVMPPVGHDDPAFKEMLLNWDGRCNTGTATGHLADPELSPYQAYISWEQSDGLKSNKEKFDVEPKIDSILITHHIWYPPPGPIIYQDVVLSSVIKGKIDDQNPDNDYRYYLYGNSHMQPEYDHRWSGDDHKYTDGSQTDYDFYEDLESAAFSEFPQRRWQINEWGPIRYEWWVIHDQREGNSGKLLDYSDRQDTTEWWGDDWTACVEAPYDEVNRKRLLVFNRLYHTRLGYPVQDCISSKDEDAHKVIFGPIEGPEGRDNIYWSSTHIGVPYGYGAKISYKHIDCSGLCIASQIQENDGPLHSGNYIIDLGNTNADMLVRDIKGGSHGSPGHIHTTVVVTDANAQRGDMIGLNHNTPPPWGHIANISYAVYDFGHDEFSDLFIYEAKGSTSEANPGPLNLVRHEDGIEYYIDRDYHKKCVRWDY